MVLLPFQPVPALEDAREKLLEWTSAREFHRALALANYILVHDFQNEIAWEAKQAILEHMGFSSSLRAMLEEAVARGGPVSLNRVLGQELLKVGRFDEAIRAYRAYLASEERFGRAAVCLGLANALRQKDGSTPADREEARRLYQQAVSHEPETLIYRLALAAFLGAEGRSAAALEHLERAESIARTPEEQCEVLRQTGEIYRLLGDWGRAEQVCTRALALVPDRIEVLHLRAFVRGYLGEFARAGEDVDRLLALAPDHEAALGMRQALEQIRRANP
jgi:tetratricopeptide (TPR) repeat protein